MKRVKKGLAITLLTATIFGGGISYATPSFQDISGLFNENNLAVASWAEQDVYSLHVNGLLNNTDLYQNSNLNQSINREEVAEIISNYLNRVVSKERLEFLQSKGRVAYFEDTNNINILNLAKLGVLEGKSKTKFFPSEEITREDVAAVMYRVEDLVWKGNNKGISIDKNRYMDSNDISEYAREAIDYFSHNNYLNGVENGEFKPKKSMSRQEFIIFMNRIYLDRKEYEISNKVK